MSDSQESSGKPNFLIVLVVLQLTVYLTVFFNIPVAREIVGFVYLTFVPGFVILKLLRLREVDRLEEIVYIVGLSIALLMFLGLLINQVGSMWGFPGPLSVLSLTTIISIFVLACGTFVHIRDGTNDILSFRGFRMPPLLPFFLSLPILSIVGAMFVNLQENNLILLSMIVLIVVLFSLAVVSERLLPTKFYPFAVFAISLALLYHSSFISKFVWGSDIHLEYYIFRTTLNNGAWNPVFLGVQDPLMGRINSMLSLTILPTIYSNMLNLDPTWVLKAVYPFVFSFVPLGLYRLFRSLGDKRAFLGVFLFMALNTFFTELLGLNRQMIAELFLVLLMLVILKKNVKPSDKVALFVLFGLALITSHYAIAEIFLFFIFVALISVLIFKWPSNRITATMVAFFAAALFFWYVYTSSAAVFDALISFGSYLYGQLGQFLNPASRGVEVLRGLGLEAAPTVWNLISRAISYLTELLIVVGFLGLITKRQKVSVERELFIFMLVAMVFLGGLIVVPGLANTLRITRFYHILLFFLAPLFVLGGELVVRLLSKSNSFRPVSFLLLAVLVLYFLFQTGFVYEITGAQSYSLSLSRYRMDRLFLSEQFVYVDEPSVVGAQWMSDNVNARIDRVFGDWFSYDNVLESYGGFYRGHLNLLSNTTVLPSKGIVFLSQLNVVYGKIIGEFYSWNSSEFSPMLDELSKIYSNGECDVYSSSTNVTISR